MPKGILYVESRPRSPEEAAAYHEWYEKTHLPEMVAIEGFVSARRFAPVGEDGPFVAVYEIEADDIEAARARLTEVAASGQMSKPVGVQTDPPATVRLLREVASYPT